MHPSPLLHPPTPPLPVLPQADLDPSPEVRAHYKELYETYRAQLRHLQEHKDAAVHMMLRASAGGWAVGVWVGSGGGRGGWVCAWGQDVCVCGWACEWGQGGGGGQHCAIWMRASGKRETVRGATVHQGPALRPHCVALRWVQVVLRWSERRTAFQGGPAVVSRPAWAAQGPCKAQQRLPLAPGRQLPAGLAHAPRCCSGVRPARALRSEASPTPPGAT